MEDCQHLDFDDFFDVCRDCGQQFGDDYEIEQVHQQDLEAQL